MDRRTQSLYLAPVPARAQRLYFSTRRLLVTPKTPETPLARMPATFLSASVATTPANVTFPFLTMI